MTNVGLLEVWHSSWVELEPAEHSLKVGSMGFKLTKTWKHHGDNTMTTLRLYTSRSFFPECVARVPISVWGSGG